MILLQAPALQSIIGMDAPVGWLPPGAAPPLPMPPEQALLDIRIFEEEGVFTLAWRSHSVVAGRPASSVGQRNFSSLIEAEREAEMQFGLTEIDWLFAGRGTPPTVADIASLRDAVLDSHEVDVVLEFEGLRAVPPRLEQFAADGQEDLNLIVVLEEEGEGAHLVFYDPDDGTFGLGIRTAEERIAYAGTYGSLWETLLAR